MRAGRCTHRRFHAENVRTDRYRPGRCGDAAPPRPERPEYHPSANHPGDRERDLRDQQRREGAAAAAPSPATGLFGDIASLNTLLADLQGRVAALEATAAG